MNKETSIFLYHILACINDILNYTKGMNEEAFLRNKMIQDAVLRNLEVMGEAAKQVPDTFRQQYVSIPWKKMAGMRDKLIHNYMGVDIKAVWSVVEDILPDLKIKLESITNP